MTSGETGQASTAAALVAGIDWASHPLGERAHWPAALKAAVQFVLGSAEPMCLMWGEDAYFFCNDSYRPIIDPRVGQPIGATLKEVWPDAYPRFAPNLQKAMAGTSTRLRSVPVAMARQGAPEETWWDYSYSPWPDAEGRIVGVIGLIHEVTPQVAGEAALRQSEARNRQILDSAIDYAIVATDLTGRITRWNEGARRILGWTEAEMLGEPADRFFTPEDVAAGRVLFEMTAALESGAGADERWHLRKGGERFWASGEMTVLRDSAGAAVGFVKVLRDRTEEHRAEAALAEAERRLRRAQEAGQVGVFSVGVGDVDIAATPEFFRIFGLPGADTLPVAEVEALVVPEDVTVASTGASRASQEMELHVEYRVRRADTGEERWIERRAEFERDAGGRALRLVGVVQDVTERHVARQALAELNATLEQRVRERTAERNLLARVVEETDAYVFVFDINYRWLAINRAGADEFERVFGIRPKVGDSILELLEGFPEDRERVRTMWSRALAGKEYTAVSEFGDLKRLDELRSYEMRFNRLDDDYGRQIGAVQIVSDVTERVRANARLQQTQEALRQSQKMEAIGQLTGGVAHDFNNLLTVIRSSADLLRRGELPEERRRRYVDAISDTADRAAKLTGQLLAFSRRQALKPEPFDVADRIASVSDMLRTVLGARIELSVETRCRPCVVDADISQFETALVNLAVNARDAMDGEGRLAIVIDEVVALPAVRGHAGGAGRFIAVSVADSGGGIAAEDLPRIFDPFFTTKDVGKGTGLGLSQVYGFAKQSGGEVDVASAEGEGATFTLYLPRSDVGAADLHAIDPPQATQPSGGLVLLVEDNSAVGEFASHLLQDLGYSTLLATGASEALAILERNDPPIDLIFSDVVMPGISGIEFARQVRAALPALPIVLTSGYSHVLAEDARHGFPLLRKPYSVQELARVLAEARAG